MDFRISPEIEDYRARIAAFVERELIPLEARPGILRHPREHPPRPLETCAPRHGLRGCGAFSSSRRPAAQGLDKVGMAVCYEAMNRSIFGPVVFNSAAPDDGNMMVLEPIGTPAQKERWLQPIVRGEVRSAFAMTEPHPGGGSDPSMIETRAEKHGDRYVVSGSEVVHHRRRGGGPLHPHRAHLGRSAPRAHRLPVPQRPAGLAHHAPHPDHGTGGAWRPLRDRVRRARDPGRERAPRRRAGPEGHPDPARAGAADPLHALARPRQALRRDRAGLCGGAARASASDSPTARASS